MAEIVLNQIAPDFTLRNQDGMKISLSDFRGKFAVLYFYPKDNTPGCTAEGCLYRDFNEEISKAGGIVFGVSADDIESHKKFRKKHEFQFDLLSDPDHEVSEIYNTWGDKKMFGRIIKGMRRSTFLINPEGKIVKIWKRANPKTNAKEAYEEILSLKNKKS